jgi:hypothetical protein
MRCGSPVCIGVRGTGDERMGDKIDALIEGGMSQRTDTARGGTVQTRGEQQWASISVYVHR